MIPFSVLAQATSCAGLAYTVCEWFHGLPFEVKNIWGSPKLPRYLWYIYLSARYTGLICEISYLIALNYLLNGPSSRRMCSIFWCTQQYAGTFEMILLHVVLSKRVHALWHNNNHIGALLVLLSTVSVVAFVTLGGVAVYKMQYMDSNCFMVKALPKEIIYVCLLEIFIQASIWSLVFIKYMSFRRQPRNEKVFRLVNHVNREGFILSILASLIPVAAVIDGISTHMTPGLVIMTYLAFPIFIAIISSAVCRTIHSIHNLSQKLEQDMSRAGEGLVLTSIGPFD
ncbi:hypothetical protein P691DRAFT_770959 [Macrolepiota fuliginosa MF-IS2]|uniref:Uncharacterized protein n=1 Tax=Macrolepiota fuliginosa MF-IS2 TaxID=1400762 RepID=A0A9P6CAB6_9AGAR|nr:hypothetical protein P691DRAFT_770959 [Macrolepiota fuliginosa MF-IS2]